MKAAARATAQLDLAGKGVLSVMATEKGRLEALMGKKEVRWEAVMEAVQEPVTVVVWTAEVVRVAEPEVGSEVEGVVVAWGAARVQSDASTW